MAQLYEVILFQSYFSELALNRWNYYSPDSIPASAGSVALLEALGFDSTDFTTAPAGTVALAMAALQADDVLYTSCSIRAIYDVLDFTEIGYPGTNGPFPGITGGDPFTAYGFRTNRVRQDIGRGYKRFAGVSGTYTGAGGLINATGQPLVDDLAAAMSVPFNLTIDGSAVVMRPCIVQKTKPNKSAVPVVVGGQYFPTLAEQESHLALDVVFTPYSSVRSQVSRQRGKGS